MPHKKLKVAENGMLDAYLALLATRGYVADAAQLRAAQEILRVYQAVTAALCVVAAPLLRLSAPTER